MRSVKTIWKKSGVFVVLAMCSGLVHAQTPPQPGDNILDPESDKFIGEWRWVNGQDTLEISLKKGNIADPFGVGYRLDVLIGFHRYKKGNTVIESSYANISTDAADKKWTLLGGSDNDDAMVFSGRLKDISKNKSGNLRMVLNADRTQLTWELSNSEGVRIGEYDWGFTLPKQLTLHKVD
ncbi:DUF6705 family protein [Sinomicrobium soli]|uniref:DUF6705 family protein n=1 Tax=Sinomicrobium sp. N-1-3-6 TaxID=2219864 RepID=UPI000DCE3164|nr:DUF6705 family protein [Sinomicrobium sp. N-1-3-6]RAV28477.1 hypothetical protein DN748_12715 [Sinomicrobium sp. N-1-3-6]